MAWFLCLLAGWLAASTFGIWSPLWLVVVLTLVVLIISHRYNAYLLWFAADFGAIIIYGLLSQLTVNLITVIGVAMTVGAFGLVVDWVADRLTNRVRMVTIAAPLVGLMLFAIFSPTAASSGISFLQSRLFTPPTVPSLSLTNDPQPQEAQACPSTPTAFAAAQPVAPETPAAANETEGVPDAEAPTETVGAWEMYEITLTSTKAYGNPFTDVDVYADFTSADNRTVRVYGFYDGDGNGNQGNLWKIRFMAGAQTTWSWRTTATDTSNSGLHDQTGQLEVVASGEPGPLAPDPQHPNAWQHADGSHFLWTLGYSIHMLGADRTHPGVGGWEDYLDWLEARRFNGVMFIMQVPSFNACSTCSKGMAPWTAIGNNPPPTYASNNNGEVDYLVMPWANAANPNETASAPNDADYNRFYLPLWQKADEIISEMQTREMVAHIFQYDDQTFRPGAGSAQERLYWEYMLRRFGAYWNVTFNDGIDLTEYRPRSWVPQWQEYFCENDSFLHPRSSRHGDDDLASATWRSVQAANDSQPRGIDAWRNLMQKSPQKPVTEDDGIRARKGGGISAPRFMQLAWWSALSGPGAFGATWGGAHDPGNWYSNLDEGGEGMRRVEIRNRFILDFDASNNLSIPFWKLTVDDELASEANVYVAADRGNHYLVYFDEGAPQSISLDLSAVSTALPVTWLNPETGERRSGGSVRDSQTFSRPFDGPTVLYIGAGEVDDTGTQPPPPPPTVDCNSYEAICAYLPLLSKD